MDEHRVQYGAMQNADRVVELDSFAGKPAQRRAERNDMRWGLLGDETERSYPDTPAGRWAYPDTRAELRPRSR